MKSLIVNADDFGRSAEVNAGIMEAHERGVVRSASLMTDRDAFEEAVVLARSHPGLRVGLHLDLDSFFEVEHGSGRLLGYRDPALPLEEMAREVERQIRKVRGAGVTPTHLDGHHHVHLRPELWGAVVALAARFGIPVIRYFPGFYEGLGAGADIAWIPELARRFGLKMVDTFFAGWEPVASSLPGYRYFDPAEEFETAELMTHPGKGEPWRERELARCCDPAFARRLDEAGITLQSFAALS